MSLQATLLGWFDVSKRDLPWRRTTDPYAIWVSEVMLQQTQVATVIPYWERFLERFPTPAALAAAPLDDVLARWSGLGYYARARHLHRAAQAIVERHDGRLPASLEALRALPGFGPYTAGAVASIAFGLDAPLVDGNVARVLCRIEGWEVGAEEARERAWALAPKLIPKGRAGDWNQALMELGATVCTPRPACDRCPVRSRCRAAMSGDPARHPLPKVRPEKKAMRLVALCVRRGEAVQLVRREEGGLFKGLWELPGETIDSTSRGSDVAKALARAIYRRGAIVERAGVVTHVLTHRRLEVEVFQASGAATPRLVSGGVWVLPEEMPQIGLGTLAVKVLRVAGVEVPGGHGRRRSALPASAR